MARHGLEKAYDALDRAQSLALALSLQKIACKSLLDIAKDSLVQSEITLVGGLGCGFCTGSGWAWLASVK